MQSYVTLGIKGPNPYLHGEICPFVLPHPCLTVGLQHHTPKSGVVYEPENREKKKTALAKLVVWQIQIEQF